VRAETSSPRKHRDVGVCLGSDDNGSVAEGLLVLVPGEQAQVLVALHSSLLHLQAIKVRCSVAESLCPGPWRAGAGSCGASQLAPAPARKLSSTSFQCVRRPDSLRLGAVR